MGYIHGSEKNVYYPVSADLREVNRIFQLHENVRLTNTGVDRAVELLPKLIGKKMPKILAKVLVEGVPNGHYNDLLESTIELQEMTIEEHEKSCMAIPKMSMSERQRMFKITLRELSELSVEVDEESCKALCELLLARKLSAEDLPPVPKYKPS